MKKNKFLKIGVQILKLVFVALAIFFLVKYFLRGINDLQAQDNLDINYIQISLSVFIVIIYLFITTFVWFLVTKKNNCNVEFINTVIIWNYANIAKYIPGKVFLYGTKYIYYDKKNKSTKKLVLSFYIEFILAMLNAVIFSLLYVYSSDNIIGENYKPILIALLSLILIFIHPKVMHFFLNMFLTLFKKEPVKTDIKYKDIFQLLTINIINWLIFGLAFMLMTNSFIEVSYEYFLLFAGAFSISSIAGMLAFFTPAGLGVREGVLVSLLLHEIPKTSATIISIFSRAWLIIAEFIFFIIAFSIDKYFKLDVWNTIMNGKKESSKK